MLQVFKLYKNGLENYQNVSSDSVPKSDFDFVSVFGLTMLLFRKKCIQPLWARSTPTSGTPGWKTHFLPSHHLTRITHNAIVPAGAFNMQPSYNYSSSNMYDLWEGINLWCARTFHVLDWRLRPLFEPHNSAVTLRGPLLSSHYPCHSSIQLVPKLFTWFVATIVTMIDSLTRWL